MDRRPITRGLFPVLLAGSICWSSQDFGPQTKPLYPLYAIISGTHRDLSQADLQLLARNFYLAQGRFSTASIRCLNEFIPDFKILHYFNSTDTSSADHVPEVEKHLGRALTMFRVANLASSIEKETTEFRLSRVTEQLFNARVTSLPGADHNAIKKNVDHHVFFGRRYRRS